MGFWDSAQSFLDGATETAQELGDDVQDLAQTAGQVQAAWTGSGGSGSPTAQPVTQPPTNGTGQVPATVQQQVTPDPWYKAWATKFGLPVWSIITLAVLVPVLGILGIVWAAKKIK